MYGCHFKLDMVAICKGLILNNTPINALCLKDFKNKSTQGPFHSAHVYQIHVTYIRKSVLKKSGKGFGKTFSKLYYKSGPLFHMVRF